MFHSFTFPMRVRVTGHLSRMWFMQRSPTHGVASTLGSVRAQQDAQTIRDVLDKVRLFDVGDDEARLEDMAAVECVVPVDQVLATLSQHSRLTLKLGAATGEMGTGGEWSVLPYFMILSYLHFSASRVNMSESLILCETPALVSMMDQVLCAAPHKPGNMSGLKLLYRGSRDGFSAKAFHQRCDNQGATLTVVRAADGAFVFGAYSDVSWSSTRDNDWLGKGEVNPWVFSLRNPKGVQPLLMVPNDSDPTKAVYLNSDYGPCFFNNDNGHGLFIRGTMTTNSNYSDISVSYQLVSESRAW